MQFDAVEFLEGLFGPADQPTRPEPNPTNDAACSPGGDPGADPLVQPGPGWPESPDDLPNDQYWEWCRRAWILEHVAGYHRERAEAIAFATILGEWRGRC